MHYIDMNKEPNRSVREAACQMREDAARALENARRMSAKAAEAWQQAHEQMGEVEAMLIRAQDALARARSKSH